MHRSSGEPREGRDSKSELSPRRTRQDGNSGLEASSSAWTTTRAFDQSTNSPFWTRCQRASAGHVGFDRCRTVRVPGGWAGSRNSVRWLASLRLFCHDKGRQTPASTPHPFIPPPGPSLLGFRTTKNPVIAALAGASSAAVRSAVTRRYLCDCPGARLPDTGFGVLPVLDLARSWFCR